MAPISAAALFRTRGVRVTKDLMVECWTVKKGRKLQLLALPQISTCRIPR